MKKVIIFLVVSIFVINTLPIKASTKNIDDIYQSEISKSIISGDGTDENPYIIDAQTAPMFSKYLNEKGEEIISTINEDDFDISVCSVFDGILKGKSHSKQTKGGYWNYSSGAPKVSVNGNIWMKKIEYLSYNDVVNICAGFSSSSFVSTFKGSIPDLVELSFSNAVKYLEKKGIKVAIAKSAVKWIGRGSTYFGRAVLLAEISNFLQQAPYKKAKNSKKGLIHAEYYTSYQGKWYSNGLSEVWSNYSTAKEPSTYYGKGTYKSRS